MSDGAAGDPPVPSPAPAATTADDAAAAAGAADPAAPAAAAAAERAAAPPADAARTSKRKDSSAPKRRFAAGRTLVDDAAEESGDEDASDGEGAEGEAGDGQDNYDLEDKFMAPDDHLSDSGRESSSVSSSSSDDDDGDSSSSSLSDDDDDDGGGGEGKKKKKKRKRRGSSTRLDEEDYDLLEENQVRGIKRPPKPGERRRIRKKHADEDNNNVAGGPSADDAQQLQEQLFGRADDDDDGDEEAPRRRRAGSADGAAVPTGRRHRSASPATAAADRRGRDDDVFFDVDDDDEMGDFIEYTPAERAARRARRAARAGPGGAAARDLPDAVADELDDIFGGGAEGQGVDDLMAEYREQAARRKARLDAAGGRADVLDVDEGEDEDESEEDEEEELSLDDFGNREAEFAEYKKNLADERAARRAARFDKLRKRRLAAARAATAAVEPAALERHMLRPEDDAARAADVPERLLDCRLPPACERVASGDLRADAPEVAREIAEAAAWVRDRLFGPLAPYSRAKRIFERGVLELDPGTLAAVEEGEEEGEEDGGAGGGGDDGDRGDRDGNNNKSKKNFFALEGDLSAADLSRLGGRRTLSLRRRGARASAWRQDQGAQRRLLASVAAVLRALWVERLEVPAIALHAPGAAVFCPPDASSAEGAASSSSSRPSSLSSAKPALGELLAMREADAPTPTTQAEAARRLAAGLPAFPEGTLQPGANGRARALRRFDALWAVADEAERWVALERRRRARLQVYAAAAAEARANGAENGGDDASDPSSPSGIVLAAAAAATAALEGAASHEDVADADAGFELARAAAAALELERLQVSRVQAALTNGADGGADGDGGDGALVVPASRSSGAGVLSVRPSSATTTTTTTTTKRPTAMTALAGGNASSTYGVCKRAGLDSLVAALGLRPAELGENLDAGYKRHEPSDPSETPEALARAFCALPTTKKPFDTSPPDTALRAARGVAAAELAAEPRLRRWVRRAFAADAALSTTPTPAGAASERLDPFHPCGRVRRLLGKPLPDCEGTDLFLRAAAAERAGLLEVSVSLPARRVEALEAELADLYLSEGASEASRAWDEQRRAVLREAVARMLRGAEAAARRALLADAERAAVGDFADELWLLARRAPVAVRAPDEDEPLAEPRFIAASHGGGDGGGPGSAGAVGSNPATAFVFLDERGALVDVLYCPGLSGPLQAPRQQRPGVDAAAAYNVMTDPRRGSDAAALRAFILRHAPHAVLVGLTSGGGGGGGPSSASSSSAGTSGRVLRDVVMGVRDHILEHDPLFLTRHETGDVEVRACDERLAALWAGSAAARDEFPDQPPAVRRAVAVGRLALDPLAVLASLSSEANGGAGEVAALSLTDVQGSLARGALLAAARRCVATAVAQVGVDLDAAASSPGNWRAPALEFVPGLGPRKAAALLRAVAGVGGRLASRADLGGGGMGGARGRGAAAARAGALLPPRVARNAVPHLFLPAAAAAASGRGGRRGGDGSALERDRSGPGAPSPLDATRVPPWLYRAAAALAAAAAKKRELAREGRGDADAEAVAAAAVAEATAADAEEASALLSRAMGRPHDVEGVDLLALAAKLQASAAAMAAQVRAATGGGDGDDDEAAKASSSSSSSSSSSLAVVTSLIDASFELVSPAADPRPPDAPLSKIDEFWLSSGLRPDLLRPGQRVDFCVRWVGRDEARGYLPGSGDVEAVLAAEDLSSSVPIGSRLDCRDRLKRGDVVAARVLALLPDECAARVTTASAALNDEERWEQELCAADDVHYLPLTRQERAELAAAPARARTAAAAARARSANKVVERRIDHPNWANVTAAEAEARLADPGVEPGQPGAALLRPHGRGALHRHCLSIKLHDGACGPIIVHRDVRERAPRPGEPPVRGTAALALKPPLTVGLGAAGLTESYDDHDELLARYFEPLAANVAAIEGHKYFVDDDSWDRVKEALRARFAAGGGSAPVYCLSPNYARPGFFYLGFVLPTRNATPHREHFGVTPRGFYYRSQLLEAADPRAGLERVVNRFKRDPQNLKGEGGGGGDGGGGGGGGGGVRSGNTRAVQQAAAAAAAAAAATAGATPAGATPYGATPYGTGGLGGGGTPFGGGPARAPFDPQAAAIAAARAAAEVMRMTATAAPPQQMQQQQQQMQQQQMPYAPPSHYQQMQQPQQAPYYPPPQQQMQMPPPQMPAGAAAPGGMDPGQHQQWAMMQAAQQAALYQQQQQQGQPPYQQQQQQQQQQYRR